MTKSSVGGPWDVYPYWEIQKPEGCDEGPYVTTNKPLTYLDKDYNTQYVWPMRVQPSRERAAKDLLDAGWALDDVLEVLRPTEPNLGNS